jgi:small subunit ribosomal protein S21
MNMAHVRVSSDESFEHALRRFINYCRRDGILSDIKAHDHYEKPSDRRKRRAKEARRRLLKLRYRDAERAPAAR